ncbi:class I SAM-dependent rRNA methyltransferase [Rubripirellula reticaptiva]|uniref:Ribosomal RNA large subunit methyltransferase I n=1 Tax=Rubripirellula reticaptiva TaxID=2528013 RepID=A0A5C6F5H1_9BACT|nr:class I SAM-dependent rRNA methyltransferase [Rubripirellula reticaptiva]TWU55657.1 Ribosomal RNA large subunit methyltransferase I [Rubripirellula reticaptiva]
MSDSASPVSSSFSSDPVALRLKPSRQFPFLARHPWVHAHALAEDGRDLACGQVVDVLDHDGNWVARGICNPASRLRIRLYGYDQSVEIGPELWKSRIDAAVARRRLTGPADAGAAERLCFSESDLLSGIIIDRYADCLGVQFTAGGLMRWKDEILDHLKASLGCRAIMVRVDPKTAKHEGGEAIEHWHRDVGIDEPVEYHQNGLRLAVDLRSGQKTGGYLDQRLNHLTVAGYLAGRRVLDVCCYQGGFGLVAAKHGAASVLGIDSSESALEAARASAARNQIETMEFKSADCFDELKEMGERGDKFDAVILDPPRFAGSRHQVDNAVRAYRRLNASAVDLLPPGGILATCSCSGRVSRSDFLNMLMDVGRRRRRDIVMLENRGPAPDHPVAISCPESDYLKCVIAQVW